MPVVFDEVMANVEPETGSNRTEGRQEQPQPGKSEELKLERVREQLERMELLEARLRAN
jgi:hypothetical protein